MSLDEPDPDQHDPDQHDPDDPDEVVITPGGPVRRSQTHRVPPGGSVRREPDGSYTVIDPTSDEQDPPHDPPTTGAPPCP